MQQQVTKREILETVAEYRQEKRTRGETTTAGT